MRRERRFQRARGAHEAGNHAAKCQSCALSFAKAANFFKVENQNNWKKSIGTLTSLESTDEYQYTSEGNRKYDLTFETCIFDEEKPRNRNICSDGYLKMSVSFWKEKHH